MRTPWQHRVLALALALSLALATCGPGAAAAAGDESARRQDAAGGELAQVGLDMHDLAASSLSDDEVLRDVKALVQRFGTALQEREPRDRGIGLPHVPICPAADHACASRLCLSWALADVLPPAPDRRVLVHCVSADAHPAAQQKRR